MIRNTRPIRVLLADDHEVVRRGVVAMLHAQRSIRVIAEAPDGRTAFELTQKLKPNVAILDLEMPELNGLEVSRKIRQLVPETNTLILTMHKSVEVIRQVLKAGALGLALKTDNGQHLVGIVKAVAQGRRSLSPNASEMLIEGVVNSPAEAGPSDDSDVLPTPREVDTIRLLASGKTNKEVAVVMGVSVKTAETYRTRIMQKLHYRSLPQLVLYAVRTHLIDADPDRPKNIMTVFSPPESTD